MLQVHEQVAWEKRLQLFGAFSSLDFFHRDLRVEAGDVLVLQMSQCAVALTGLVLQGVPSHLYQLPAAMKCGLSTSSLPYCKGLPSSVSTLPPAAESTAWAAPVSHSQVGPNLG